MTGLLARPQAVQNFYQDIAVLAMPAGVPAGRATSASKTSRASRRQFPSTFPRSGPAFAAVPADGSVIPRKRIVDLTDKMDAAGKLAWDVPEGKWLILRFGHTTTGKDNHPAPATGRGLECDKLSKQAAEAHFNGLMGRLIADNRALAGKDKVLVSTHIDSWEVGSQNWTPRMREEFQKRRGYDLLPLLPTFTGRVVDSPEVSERFLWDLRQTVSDMLIENYAGHFRTLANRHGPAALDRGLRRRAVRRDDLRRPGRRADGRVLVVGQVRRGLQLHRDVLRGPRLRQADPRRRGLHGHRRREMARPPGLHQGPGRLGLLRRDQPLRVPSLRHAALDQPQSRPGMSMGPWGLHYERTQTWWEQSKAWHEYLARCQYLLQQGLFVADICYLQPEGAPRRFAPPSTAMIAPYVRGGYNFDGCTPEVVLTRMSVKDGRIVLPDGMSYRLLVLPQVETMTPALLGQDQGTGRGRGDGRGAVTPAEVAGAEQLPGLR